MKFKFSIRREMKIAAVLLVLLGLIAFTERMKDEVTVSAIQISLDNIHENHYLDENDVMRLMRLNTENLRGANISQLNFSDIEHRIRQSPYVSDAELYSDLKGNLHVSVTLRRPVARLVQPDGPDAYVAEDGTVMPVSGKFSSRVALISGALVPALLKLDNLHEREEGHNLMALMETVREDSFWQAQIAQIDIDNKGKVVMYPQVGDETIEFGRAEDIEVKLRKLEIFYKEILPTVGWNRYDRINVEYEGQVVAE